MASSKDRRWEVSRNVTTEPMASPARRIGWDQYSTGKLVPSLRQKTSSLEWASLLDRNALTMAHSRIGNGVPSAWVFRATKRGVNHKHFLGGEKPNYASGRDFQNSTGHKHPNPPDPPPR